MLKQAAVGLDIGTTAIRAAEVVRKDPVVLTKFAQVALPAGAVADGEVADADSLVTQLKDLWRRGGFRTKRVALGVANQKVVVRQVDVPYMEEESELRAALQFQVQEFIPIPIEEAILDFLVLEEFAGENGERMLRVLLVAAQRDMINGFVDAVTRAGLEPVLIDLCPFAALRPLTQGGISLLAEKEGEAVIDIGGDVTTVVVHELGVPRFVRIIPQGGADITESLATGLGVPIGEAETMKVGLGLAPESGPMPTEGAAGLIEHAASAFLDEVRGSLDYYLAQSGSARVGKAVVIGGGSRLPNLRERLSSLLRIPVEEGQPLAAVKLGKLGLTQEQLLEASAVSAVAIGLSLGAA